MATNLNRTVVEEKTVDFLNFVRFSTGAYHVSHVDSRTRVLTLTNTDSLVEDGYLKKLEALLVDPDTFALQSRFYGGVVLELRPKLEAGFKFILDNELRPSAKLTYIISLLCFGLPLSVETLQTVFTARPDPLFEVDRLSRTMKNLTEGSLLRNALFPDFSAPAIRLWREDEYRRYCLTVSFVSSPTAVRFADFQAANATNFFIPTHPQRTTWAREKLYAPVDDKLVADLFPSEYDRFMRYFNRDVVKELRGWAKKRFDSGVEPLKELVDKGVVARRGAPTWGAVTAYLTVEEAQSFVKYIVETNGIGKIYLDAEVDVAGLIAFYWVEGGPDKLNELAQHISASQMSQEDQGFGMIQKITLRWSNPYAARSKRPDLMPYVKALTDPVFRSMPLEWALASY